MVALILRRHEEAHAAQMKGEGEGAVQGDVEGVERLLSELDVLQEGEFACARKL